MHDHQTDPADPRRDGAERSRRRSVSRVLLTRGRVISHADAPWAKRARFSRLITAVLACWTTWMLIEFETAESLAELWADIDPAILAVVLLGVIVAAVTWAGMRLNNNPTH